jgi:hypothetical protein
VTTATELRFVATPASGHVSALFDRPQGARWLLVLAHGAGAGMRHPFMAAATNALAARRIATLRYQFPYMERSGSRMERRDFRPDPQPVLFETVRSAVSAAHDAAPDLPLLAGGKSMGGRMTSLASAESPLPDVRGLVFLGFPLHAAGLADSGRAKHLERVPVPMLFLQGTRDKLASLELLRPVIEQLGSRATLHVIEGGDHSFKVTKRSGRSEAEVLEELAQAVENWAAGMD